MITFAVVMVIIMTKVLVMVVIATTAAVITRAMHMTLTVMMLKMKLMMLVPLWICCLFHSPLVRVSSGPPLFCCQRRRSKSVPFLPAPAVDQTKATDSYTRLTCCPFASSLFSINTTVKANSYTRTALTQEDISCNAFRHIHCNYLVQFCPRGKVGIRLTLLAYTLQLSCTSLSKG